MKVGPPGLLFGVAVDDVAIDDVLALVDHLVEVGRTSGATFQIATVNVDFLVNASRDPSVRRILQDAEVCVADGMPVVWGSRLLRPPLRERVAGADLVPALIGASQTTGHHVHIFGSAPDVAASADRLLRARFPDARLSIDPGPRIDDPTHVDDRILDSIRSVGPDVLCVALGNPKQERFIAAHREALRVPVAIGVGGSLDLLTGRRRRAPMWVRRAGLEWLARAVQEPRRLGRRYARDIAVFGPGFARELRRVRRARPGATGLALEVSAERVVVRLGAIGLPDRSRWDDAVTALWGGTSMLVQVERDPALGHEALAHLLGLTRIARWAPVPVDWDADRARVVASLGGRVDLRLIGFPGA